MLAFPVVGVGVASKAIDDANGINYDYWPSPVTYELEDITGLEGTQRSPLFEDFDAKRRTAAIRPKVKPETRREKRAKKIQARKAQLKDADRADAGSSSRLRPH